MHKKNKRVNKLMKEISVFLGLKKKEKKKITSSRDILKEYNLDKELEEHLLRTGRYAKVLAELMCLDKDIQEEVKKGALLHDIGKTLINQDILKKESKLNQEEMDEIRKHPKLGLKILKSKHQSKIVENVIICHHERWDGNGCATRFIVKSYNM